MKCLLVDTADNASTLAQQSVDGNIDGKNIDAAATNDDGDDDDDVAREEEERMERTRSPLQRDNAT